MQDPTLREDGSPGDRLDADLVCEQCGTVNQPGTLYCHNCGNNLREQRQKRLAGGEPIVMEAGPDRPRMIFGALSVIGLLIVVVVALNVNSIAERMVGMESPIDTNIYWQGPLAAEFESMAAELAENRLTAEQIRTATDDPLPISSFEGRFIVRLVLTVERNLGQAIARERNGVILFLVAMDSGAEVRGTARVEDGNRLSSSSSTYSMDTRMIGGFGFGVPHPEGGYAVTGASDLDERPFQLRIYRAD